jgi:hypothetical protein
MMNTMSLDAGRNISRGAETNLKHLEKAAVIDPHHRAVVVEVAAVDAVAQVQVHQAVMLPTVEDVAPRQKDLLEKVNLVRDPKIDITTVVRIIARMREMKSKT